MKRIIVYVGILFLFTLIIISPELSFLINEGSIEHIFSNFLLVSLFFLIPLIFFYKRPTIYYFLIVLYCSLTPVLFLPLILIHEKISPEIISAALNSNIPEIRELFGWKLLLPLALIIIFFWLARFLTKPLPKKIEFRIAAFTSMISACFFAFLIYAEGDKSIDYASNLKFEMSEKYPFSLILSAYSIIKTDHLENNYLNNTAHFSFGSYKTLQSKQRIIQVLVIGESSRYDHWGINGYNRNTSPFISNEKNLVTFSDVAAGATLTLTSVPFLITRVNINNISNHLKEKSIMAAFKEAGFYTAWISNQNGNYENITSEFHTVDCDTTIFTNVSGGGDKIFETSGLYDESLIQPFKNLIKNTSSDLFIVIHTMGSHWRYKFRYPENYDVFGSTKNINESKSYSSRQELIDEYDNSILYTDHILNSLIDELKKTNTISSLLYISDHGENLKDNENNLMFHSAIPNFYTAHVPLFIWHSDSLKKQLPEIEQALNNNKNKPISSVQSVFYTTLNLGGINIKVDSNMGQYSLASLEYKNSEQKISGESNVIYSFKNLQK